MITTKVLISYLWILCYIGDKCNGNDNPERSITSCMTPDHDAVNPKFVRLVCNDYEMIRVKRVFMATTEVPLADAHNWCDFPGHQPSHCRAFENQLTDEFRQGCNTISVCSLKQYDTELSNCYPNTFNPQTARIKYIHVEFDCLPRNDPTNNNQQIEYVQLYPQLTETHGGSMLYLLSLDYPSLQPSESKSVCMISLPQNTYGSMKILDLQYTANQQLICPVRIDVPGEFKCADPSMKEYAGFMLSPAHHQRDLSSYNIHLEVTKDPRVETLRLWLEVSAFDMQGYYHSGMTVTCQEQLIPQPNPVPNPTPIPTISKSSNAPPSENGTDAGYQAQASKMEAGTMYAIISGAVAGVIMIIIVIILVVCFRKRRSTNKSENDLGYVCHANVSAAKKMGAEQNSYSETQPRISVIEPYGKTGGGWFKKESSSSDTQNLYSDVDDHRYSRESGQYSSIDIYAPQSSGVPFSYSNIDKEYSDVEDNKSVCVVDTNNGKTTAKMYSVPIQLRTLPSTPQTAATDHVYARPDKSAKVKLTSQSSAHSETQMMENDLYNI